MSAFHEIRKLARNIPLTSVQPLSMKYQSISIEIHALWGLPQRRRRCRRWEPEVSGLQATWLETRRSQGFANQHAADVSW